MIKNEDNSNKGCWLPIIILIAGFSLIASPLNPFLEFRSIGEEDYLTNSSLLVTVVLIGGLIWFVVERFKDK